MKFWRWIRSVWARIGASEPPTASEMFRLRDRDDAQRSSSLVGNKLRSLGEVERAELDDFAGRVARGEVDPPTGGA